MGATLVEIYHVEGAVVLLMNNARLHPVLS